MLYIPDWLLSVWPWVGLIVIELLLLAGMVVGLVKLNHYGPQLVAQLPHLNEALRAQGKQLHAVRLTVNTIGTQLLQLLSWGAVQKFVFRR